MPIERGAVPPLVLVSTSPRRHALLTDLGYQFQTVAPRLHDEVLNASVSLGEAIEQLAHEKAASVQAQYPSHILIGADTIVVCDDLVLGKPNNAHEAKQMLELLSGRAHEVISGVALIRTTDQATMCFHECTSVHFRTLSKHHMDAYISCGEWQGKAGGYAIQGKGVTLCEGIEGSYSNVVGLPLEKLYRALVDWGVDIFGTIDEQIHHQRIS